MSEVESTGDGDSLNDSDGDGTDSPGGSTHVDEHGKHFNESDPIADHLDEEDPQDITSTLPVSECHDAPFKREEGTDDDYIEPYLTAYHFVVTSHDSPEQKQASVAGDKTTNQNNNSLSQPTPKCQDVTSTVVVPQKTTSINWHNNDNPHDEEAHEARQYVGDSHVSTDHEYTYIPDTYTENHEYTYIPDTYTENREYTYIDDTAVKGRQDAAEGRGSLPAALDSQDPSVSITADCLVQNPMYVPNNAPRQGEQEANILVCLLKYYKDVAVFIFVTTLAIVGLLLITDILPPEEGITTYTQPIWSTNTTPSNALWTSGSSMGVTTSVPTVAAGRNNTNDSNSYHGDLMSENMTGVAGTKDTPTMVTRTLDFDERPSTVAMSANGKIAVAFSDPSVYIYDSEGILLLRFGTPTMTWAFPPHDISFCNCTNDDDVLVVGGNHFIHSVGLYSVTGRLITSFAIPSTPAHHRLAFSKSHSLVYVTETVRNHREVKVYGLDGTLVRRFGREQMLTSLAAIAVDNEDYILVADSYSAKIYMYDNNGKFMFSFAGKGIGNGKLGFPVDICTDSSRHIIVADLGNQRVEMFTSRGEFIRNIAMDVDPLRMAVGPAGQLVLVEAAKKKVTILIKY